VKIVKRITAKMQSMNSKRLGLDIIDDEEEWYATDSSMSMDDTKGDLWRINFERADTRVISVETNAILKAHRT